MDKITLRELTIRIGKDIGPGPFCIETGASSTIIPGHDSNLPHTSTHNIVWHIAKPNGGMLWTYDNRQEPLDICEQALKDDLDYWKGILGDSVEMLQQSVFPREIDFVHLDGAEDLDTMLGEYQAIREYLSPNAVVCCDDIHNPTSIKWVKAVPVFKEEARSWFEAPTSLGTFVAFMGDTLGGF